MRREAAARQAVKDACKGVIANTHASNLREQVQPCKVLHTDYAPREYAESKLLEDLLDGFALPCRVRVGFLGGVACLL